MARGYSALADTMRTVDGVELASLYNELLAVAAVQNEQRQRFLDLFTATTTQPTVPVLQSPGSAGNIFEKSSEYGVPQASRVTPELLHMGADFNWYDSAWRATWQYLASATAAEVSANANAILEADRELVFNEVMATIFDNTNRTILDSRTQQQQTVYAFANGDGWEPPSYAGNTFSGSYSHYRVSGSATVTSGDLDEIVDSFKSHGYSAENGSQIVVFVNSTEGDRIGTFRTATGARADFIPAAGARFYTPDQLVGQQPSATFAGFNVKGAYDEALIIESSRIPVGYMVGLVSGGSLVPSNPILLREHDRIRGLSLIEGPRSNYPLIDSYWVRGFGTGVRHRLAGLVMQVKASGSYEPPARYAR